MNAEENTIRTVALTLDDSKENITDTIYVCPMHSEVKSLLPGKCPTCEMDLIPVEYEKVSTASSTKEEATNVTSEGYYTCSMHPEVHSDKPGNCPKCGMKLVKNSEAGSGMHGMMGMMNSGWMIIGMGMVMVVAMAIHFVK